ncbi:zinc finger protein 142-like [Anoplophora glabripennis]|uniref:zinc finger protein 142-like n=1 Tax=Anoplophora glabripennis TaxID=217634 RepID=UPI000C777D1D|nr:zinc finger protein 142-like [Anoplophora glabripennis]
MLLQSSNVVLFEESYCKDEEGYGCKHENGSEVESKQERKVQMYRCNDCDYETKYKMNIKSHQSKHKDPSQVQMYRCDECDYETELKGNIKKHQLKHKEPSQKFDGKCKEVICNICRRKLNMASEFKSTCLNTDNTIMLYVDNEKMLQLDLREVYMQQKKSELVDIPCSQKICRLCMHPVESEFRCIREQELEAIEKLAPEMNIDIVKDPVVCKGCFDSLCTHNTFLKDCSEVEEKIKSVFGSSATGSQLDTSAFGLFVKTENLDKEFDIEMEMSIKAEYVDIKSEDEERSDTPLRTSNIVSFNDCKDAEEHGSGIRFSAKHDSDSKVYKYESCEYETENKRHLLKHKDPSEVQMYRCNDCDYETKYKYAIKLHQLKHKDPSCKDCNYETVYKMNMKQHQLRHKKPSQVQIYKCKDCDYETKYKSNIKLHQLRHEDSSQVQMYRCNECNYETKLKGNTFMKTKLK